MSQQFKNIMYLADTSGTGFWRHIQQILQVGCIGADLGIANTYTVNPILDQNYYKGMTSVHIQRWIGKDHENLFTKFLKPVCDLNSTWIVYCIDDAMHYDEIPLYNRGRFAFANDQIQDSIKLMLNESDFLVTTTAHIKEYYHRKYGVPLENIIAVPNFLPRWWFGDRFDPDKKLKQLQKNKAKPRIGIVSSLSHYNIEKVRKHVKTGKACHQIEEDGKKVWVDQDKTPIDVNDTIAILDDFDIVHECVRSTVNDFQWVIFGHCPPQIKDLADAKKVEVHNGVPITNYASKLENLELQAIVAPIQPMEFNYCKSHIKTMECAAIGVPLFATNCLPYSRVMDKNYLFNDGNDLKDKLLKFKFRGTGAYKEKIMNDWKWLNSPTHEGDFDIKNYWLEDNIGIWIDLMRMRQKTLNVSMKLYAEHKRKQAEEEKKNVIFKNESGITITK